MPSGIVEQNLYIAIIKSSGAVTTQDIEKSCQEIRACLTACIGTEISPFKPPVNVNDGKPHDPLFYRVLRNCSSRVIKEFADFARKNNIIINFEEKPLFGGAPAPFNALQMVAIYAPQNLEQACNIADSIAKSHPEEYRTSTEILSEPIFITVKGVTKKITIEEYMVSSITPNAIVNGRFDSQRHKSITRKWATNTTTEPIEEGADEEIVVTLECGAEGLAFMEETHRTSIADIETYRKDLTKPQYRFPTWIHEVDKVANADNIVPWQKYANGFISKLSAVKFLEVLKNGLRVSTTNFLGRDPRTFIIKFDRSNLIKLCDAAEARRNSRLTEAAEAREAKLHYSSGSSGSGDSPTTLPRRESVERLITAAVAAVDAKHDAKHEELRDEHESLITVQERKQLLPKLASPRAKQLYAVLRDEFAETLNAAGSRYNFEDVFRNVRVDIVVGAGLALISLAPHAGQSAAAAGGAMLNHWQRTQGDAQKEEFVFSITSNDYTVDAKLKLAMVLAFNLVKSQEENLDSLPPKQIAVLKKRALELLDSGIHDLVKATKHPAHGREGHGARERSNPVTFLSEHIDEGLRKGPSSASCVVS